MRITEDLLQFIWNSKYLLQHDLRLTDGSAIQIIQNGILNRNQGPDFLLSKIKINDTIWAGNVEIHVQASQWLDHQHQDDEQYKNVILHVVYEEDKILDHNVPCLVLNNYISQDILIKYQNLMDSHLDISCSNQILDVPDIIVRSQLERMMVSRFENKVDKIKKELAALSYNWEQLFYRKLCHYLVTPVNTEAMAALNERIDFDLVMRYSGDINRIEALLLGTAGFIDASNEDYVQQLASEYNFLSAKHNIIPLLRVHWKFLRMRPYHFPTYRLAQVAAIYNQLQQPFAATFHAHSLSDLYQLLQVNTSEFWFTHFNLEHSSGRIKSTAVGKTTLDIIIINVIAPMYYAYAEINHQPMLRDKVELWLKHIKPESNRYTKLWHNIGIKPLHSGESQAMIEQFSTLCSYHKCLQCKIGSKLLLSN